MTYVLDTNVVSALMRGDAEPTRRLLSMDRSRVLLPQPVIGEIEYGIARLPRSRTRTSLETRARALFVALPRAPWTDEVSARFGATKAALEREGRRLEDFDIAIAAHALAVGAAVASANVRHLGRIEGLRVEDWSVSPSAPEK